ncbi:MAG: phosphodiesterase [Planctomycetota bacterium]|jgi:hypothetical protein
MKFLAHRGFWRDRAERNTLAAFQRAFDHGFGLETDVRDLAGELVISHDVPLAGAMPFADLLTMYAGSEPTLALNIKSDGLGGLLTEALARFAPVNYFLFDMTVPQMIGLAKDHPVYYRRSEIEAQTTFPFKVGGVWLDGFWQEWWSTDLISGLLSSGLQVAVVSPELHGRPHAEAWRRLAEAGLTDQPGLSLCTDLPMDAQSFFGGQT